MVLSHLLGSSQGFWRRLLPKKMATSEDLVGGVNASIHSAKWLSFRASVVLVTLLATLLWLTGIENIEITIAILSVTSNGISQLLGRYFSLSELKMVENDLFDTLDALGAAGVGTLIILYLLV
ncbi:MULTISPECIES: hypothetical protein [Halomonadaceae]|uniref:Uncharacterized protein n=2 Tax=Vreelandella TaxID=3137766 RepID=A0A7Z0RY78_9GAMM|nr:MULTISPECIES: hypothetical protein [Halomonas]NYS77955.1 hypothetical protein [Halomonas glaciei]|tara:strand:+ start:238 stop:606 length:369 start_codon:yes stop_codon:yes gene_type:complete